MNESQARKLAEVYESMGYDNINVEDTGGGVWIVRLTRPDDVEIVFGRDVIEQTMPGDGDYHNVFHKEIYL